MSRKDLSCNEIVDVVYKETLSIENKGALAEYIPELANVDPEKFGVYFANLHGEDCGVGNYADRFSIQSISKVLSLCLAYGKLGEDIWARVGVEPSGTAFNSISQLESDRGIPRNPFINAGAIVVADILLSELENPKGDFLNFVRKLSNDTSINYSRKIAWSEKSVGYRNVALCNYIKSFGNLNNEPDKVLDFYFDLCSLEASCEGLAKMFLFLANQGVALHNKIQILTKSQSKRINALMQTCGFYDESGEFAFRVGLAGKSGVGGGIIAIHPSQYAIAVYSPKLNLKGNSFRGIYFLEKFTTISEQSIF